jgi:hypothetical protein
MDEDDGQRRRALIRAIAHTARGRDRLTDALTEEVYALGITATAAEARILAATAILRATGDIGSPLAPVPVPGVESWHGHAAYQARRHQFRFS